MTTNCPDDQELPIELQEGSPIYTAVYEIVNAQLFAAKGVIADVMRALAPLLWPLLPSNDQSAAAQINRLTAQLTDPGARYSMACTCPGGYPNAQQPHDDNCPVSEWRLMPERAYAPIAPDQTASSAAGEIVDPTQ